MGQISLLFGFLALLVTVDAMARVKLARSKVSRGRLLATGSWNEGLTNAANYLYYGSVQVGTPGQTVTVDFDTGSDMFWVSCNCAAGDVGGQDPGAKNYCATHSHIFKTTTSTTNSKTTNPFSVSYGSGFVDGVIMFDKVCIPGSTHCSAANQRMGCASFTDSSFQNSAGNPDSDGLMGLAYGFAKMGQSPMRSIFNQAACPSKVFAFYLNRVGDTSKSEMTICGTDPAHYVAPLHYLNVSTVSYYWTVTMNKVAIGGTTAWSASASNAIILDTGTTGIYLPGTLVTKIKNACTGCSCPTLTFTLNGVQFNLPGSYYVDTDCSLLIYSSPETSAFANYGANWILGDAFLRRFYSVYDFANSQVALAPAA